MKHEIYFLPKDQTYETLDLVIVDVDVLFFYFRVIYDDSQIDFKGS